MLNIGVEGLMLMGALVGFLGSYYTHSPWIGLIAGMLGAAIIGMLFAFLTISLGADQVVAGIAINILCVGLAVFINRAVFGIYTMPPKAAAFPTIALPVLSKIPIVGPVLFQHYVPVWIGFLLVPLAWVVLFRTTYGLRVTAVGENPRASDTAGVHVHLVRYSCVLIGALLAGYAGAILALGQLNLFKETMVAGRGFIAVAVVILGRWNPVGALGAALVFGFADALQLRLQALGFNLIPSQLLVTLPYLVTLIVVIVGMGKAMMPKALCVPYLRRQGR